MSADGPVQVSFTFEDIAVYFSEEEWNLLHEKQRELYRSTMIEHYETLVSLGFLTFKPGIIRRIENREGLFFLKSEKEERLATEGLPPVYYQAGKGGAKAYEGETRKSPVPVISKTVAEAITKTPDSSNNANVLDQKTPIFLNRDNSIDKAVAVEKLSDGFNQAASNKENGIHRSVPPSTCSETLTDNKLSPGEVSPLRRRLRTDSRENVPKGGSAPFLNDQGSRSKEKIIQGMKVLITKHPLSDVRKQRTVCRVLTPVPEEPPFQEAQEASSVERQANGAGDGDSNRLLVSNGESLMQEVSSSSGEDQSIRVNQCVGELQISPTEQSQTLTNRNSDTFSTEHLPGSQPRKSNRGHSELRKSLPRKPKEPIVYYLRRKEAGEQPKTSVQLKSSPVLTSGCFVKLIDFQRHQKTRRGKDHSCSECRKRFRTRNALTHHMKIHTSGRPYACSECAKRFRKAYHLQAHHQSVHAKLRPFKCTECGKSFGQKGTLMNHAKTHTGEKPCICTVCGRAFSRLEPLKVHMRTHTGERPYNCLDCGSSFRHSATLVAHQRKHTGERPFVCSDCGRGFTRNETLSAHKRLHTGEKPYACDECGKRFTQSESLVRHQRTHTGVMPYTCTVCGKCFRHLASVVAHKRIHTGERPFKCSQCDKAFSHTASLRLHLQYHARQRHICKECRKSFRHLAQLNKHMLVHKS